MNKYPESTDSSKRLYCGSVSSMLGKYHHTVFAENKDVCDEKVHELSYKGHEQGFVLYNSQIVTVSIKAIDAFYGTGNTITKEVESAGYIIV